MGRAILAILLAPIIWGLVGVPINMLLMTVYGEQVSSAVSADDFPVSYLMLSILLSCGYSMVAGYCAIWIAAGRERLVGLGAGIALLLVGIGVQASAWELLPLWYHLVFLTALVPFTLIGARLRSKRLPV